MKGYPQHFATKEDYMNIIRDFPEWRGRVKKDLKVLEAIRDDVVTRAVGLINPNDPDSEWITEEIKNPSPHFKQKGFQSKKEVVELIKEIEKREGRKW